MSGGILRFDRLFQRLDGMRKFFPLIMALLLPLSATAADVMVFAAASLKESLDAVAKEFKGSSGHTVAISYAASSALAKQIEQFSNKELVDAILLTHDKIVDQFKINPLITSRPAPIQAYRRSSADDRA